MKRKKTTEHYTNLESLRKAWGLKPVPFRKKQRLIPNKDLETVEHRKDLLENKS